MRKRLLLLLVVTHLMVGAFGFATGIYVLPILTAPPAPSEQDISQMAAEALYSAEFKKDLKGSDALHWGEGTVSIGPDFITLIGTLAPGPDYQLYLSPEFVETELDFNRLKSSMARVSDVKTFENFAIAVPENIDPSNYTSVIIWCETFGEFITAARYR